jgi:hypothetical protein
MPKSIPSIKIEAISRDCFFSFLKNYAILGNAMNQYIR